MTCARITAPYPPCGACLACKQLQGYTERGGGGQEAIVQEVICWYSDQPWYVVELQQGAERGPVEVTGVSTDNSGFVGCTEIGYLVRTQLVAELDEALSAV